MPSKALTTTELVTAIKDFLEAYDAWREDAEHSDTNYDTWEKIEALRELTD